MPVTDINVSMADFHSVQLSSHTQFSIVVMFVSHCVHKCSQYFSSTLLLVSVRTEYFLVFCFSNNNKVFALPHSMCYLGFCLAQGFYKMCRAHSSTFRLVLDGGIEQKKNKKNKNYDEIQTTKLLHCELVTEGFLFLCTVSLLFVMFQVCRIIPKLRMDTCHITNNVHYVKLEYALAT